MEKQEIPLFRLLDKTPSWVWFTAAIWLGWGLLDWRFIFLISGATCLGFGVTKLWEEIKTKKT